MLLYMGMGPSAQTVRMVMAEKKLSIETRELDLLGREHLSDELKALNPGGQVPFAVLDDGFVLGESLAICDYLEELQPEPSLLGSTARERAETRMWCRRIDLRIMEPAILSFKATRGKEFFKDRYYLVESGAKDLHTLSRHNLAWLESQMGDNAYICGDRFSLADIQLYCFLAFNAGVPESLPALAAWAQRIAQRPSASP